LPLDKQPDKQKALRGEEIKENTPQSAFAY